MQVLYDYQAFEFQKFGGVSRYFFELLNNFNNSKLVDWNLPIQYSSNIYLKQLDDIIRLSGKADFYHNFLGGKEFKGKWKIYNFRNKVFPQYNLNLRNKDLSINTIRQNKFDLFHPTYFEDYFLDFIKQKPFVVTVHDMTHEIYSECFPSLLLSKFLHNKKKVVQKADKIIAVSENTKKDIIELFSIPEDKIEVIHHGCSINKVDVDLSIQLPDKFLLYIGSRGAYKNFNFFLQSVQPILKKNKDIHVVCVGEPFDKIEKSYFDYLSITDQLHQYSVEDAELAYFYSKAMFFIFPSLYEGFGLPILEAFNCGCPVILSNASSFPEIGGDAGLYFNPKSASSIQEVISAAVNDSELRNKLIQRGFEQAKKFSWEKTAIKTAHLYKNLL